MIVNPAKSKREVDFQQIQEWISPNSRVLDLGCGRGVLLDQLERTRDAHGIGVDSNPEKILACIKRGLVAYQGDIGSFMTEFPDDFFDWVICSRTVQELARPRAIIIEALRVARHFALGFANYALWSKLEAADNLLGEDANPLFQHPWWDARPAVPVSIKAFEAFCVTEAITINRSHFLEPDWETVIQPDDPRRFADAGYASYDLSRG